MRYVLRPNIFAIKITNEEVCVGGGNQLLALQGRADVLLKLLQLLAGARPYELEQLVLEIQQMIGMKSEPELHQLRSGLDMVIMSLRDSGCIESESDTIKNPEDRRVLFLRNGNSGVLEFLKLIASDLQYLDVSLRDGRAYPDHKHFPNVQDFLMTQKKSLESSLLVADGLDEHELYAVNKFCLANDCRWTFISYGQDQITVSPVLQRHITPCYRCFRLRRIASIEDVVPNALVEAHIMNSPPDVRTLPECDRATVAQIAGMVARKLSMRFKVSHSFTFISKITGSSSSVEMLKMPGCIHCA